MKKEKENLFNEDSLFYKISKSVNNVKIRDQISYIGSVNFNSNAGIDNKIFVSGSSLTVSKLHKIFSY